MRTTDEFLKDETKTIAEQHLEIEQVKMIKLLKEGCDNDELCTQQGRINMLKDLIKEPSK